MILFLTCAVAVAADSASTTATLGPWTITGLDGQGYHTHGGEPAWLGQAQFRVVFAGEAPAALQVVDIAFLTGRKCAAPAELQSKPRFGGLFPEDGSLRESVRTLPIAPGTHEISVGFEAVQAYLSWCDRFAFRVTFDAGGQRLVVVAETHLTRWEPLDLSPP